MDPTFVVLGGLALTAGLGVVGVGVPLVGRLSDLRVRRERARLAHDDRAGEAEVGPTRTFTPLDLGPDPLRWPSEVNRRPYVDQLSWPSAHWPDGPFGLGSHSPPAPVVEGATGAVVHRPRQPTAGAAPEPARRERGSATRRPPSPAPEATPATAPPPAASLPSPEEVAALVRREGLADAVRMLRRPGLSTDMITELLLRASSDKG